MNHTLQCIDLKLWFVNIFISWTDRLYVYLCTNILWDAIYVGIAFVLKNLHRFFYFSNTLTAHFILADKWISHKKKTPGNLPTFTFEYNITSW